MRTAQRSRHGKKDIHTVMMKYISSQITPYLYRYIDEGQQSLVFSFAVDLRISPVNSVCLCVVFLFLFQMD